MTSRSFIAILFPNLTEKNQKWLAACIFLFAIFFERFAYYGFTSCFVYSLTTDSYSYNWCYGNAVKLYLSFNIISFVIGLISAFTADFWICRIRLLALSMAIYLLGFIGLICTHQAVAGDDPSRGYFLCAELSQTIKDFNSTELPYFAEPCSDYITLFVICISVGAGLAKPFLAFFGADQIRRLGIFDVQRYFLWFYAATNLGSIFGLIIPVSYTSHTTWLTTLLICMTNLLLASILLAIGLLIYDTNASHGQLSYIMEISLRALPFFSKKPPVGRGSYSLMSNKPAEHPKDFIGNKRDESQMKSWGFERLKCENNGPYLSLDVESVKSLMFALGIFWIVAPFFVVLTQKDTSYRQQAKFLHLPEHPESMRRFTGWLDAFTDGPIILCCLFIVLCVMPYLKRKHILPSIRMRVLIGMLFGSASVLSAGVTEYFRNRKFNETIFIQTTGDTDFLATDLSVFWIIPQYVFLALGEVLVSVTVLEYMYLSSTPWLRNVPAAIFWVTWGTAEMISTTIDLLLMNIENDYMDCLKPLKPPFSYVFDSKTYMGQLVTLSTTRLPNVEYASTSSIPSRKKSLLCPVNESMYLYFLLFIILFVWSLFLIACTRRRWFCSSILSSEHAYFMFESTMELEEANQFIPSGIQTYPSGKRPDDDILPLLID